MGNTKRETGSLLIAEQNDALRTDYGKAKPYIFYKFYE